MSDRCCPRHDPITCAGFVICKTCGRRGYPSDAEWIDGDLILATFNAPCSHAKAQTQVVMPSQLEEITTPEPDRCQGKVRTGARKGQRCTRLAKPGSEYCTQHYTPPSRCAGLVKAGTRYARPCRLPADPGSDYCSHHQAQGANK